MATPPQEVVRRHAIAVHMYPSVQIVGGHRRAVGFDLELTGHAAHAHGDDGGELALDKLGATCNACLDVWHALEALVTPLLAPHPDDIVATIRPADRAIELDPRDPAPRTRLVVEVRRRDALAETSPEEENYARTLERRLHDAGVGNA